jgi:hypothetical protein
MHPRVIVKGDSKVQNRILFAIGFILIGVLSAHWAWAQSIRVRPADIYPYPTRTPGAANPQVTQQNIKNTICSRQWSAKQMRPPAELTSKLKKKQLREYGDTVEMTGPQLINPNTGKVDTTRCVGHSDNPACHEEDHLIPLEDGGDPTDPRNLWPEPYNAKIGWAIMGAHQKDVVGAFIHDEIRYDVPHSKRASHIPATTFVTLKRGQEILASHRYAC